MKKTAEERAKCRPGKKAIHYEEARERYVYGVEPLRDIAKSYKVSEPTILLWAKKGGWEVDRKKYQEERDSILSDRIQITSKLGKTILKKLDTGREPSAAELNAYRALTENLSNVKKFEEEQTAPQGDDKEKKIAQALSVLTRQ